jgi:hypothetical protein
MEKYDRIRHTTDKNMARAFGMLNNLGYSHTLRIYLILLSHGNNGYVNAPHSYVLSVLL